MFHICFDICYHNVIVDNPTLTRHDIFGFTIYIMRRYEGVIQWWFRLTGLRPRTLSSAFIFILNARVVELNQLADTNAPAQPATRYHVIFKLN